MTGRDVGKAESAPGPQPAEPRDPRRLLFLSLAALGVVYGDIGTSPLYALRECFHGTYGLAPSHENVLGILSLMFWSLLVIVSFKYLALMLRADNEGEGGVIALTALLSPRRRHGAPRRRALLLGMGLFGAALLYGDGMITPAISVSSAVEGIETLAPGFDRFVLPTTIAILVGLFLIQHRGTAKVGAFFGPLMLVWFTVLALLGVGGVLREPAVLAALLPWHGLAFLFANGLPGFLVLGSVFLVVTGAEALYADMGHFGARPIRLAWFCVALPALLLNYFGQGALLLTAPADTPNPFYDLSPSWFRLPLVALATAATVVASQAVISGAFSMTRQAVQLGYLPRTRIVHTSEDEIGQVYVPQVNWLLMLSTILLVLAFGSSSNLAAAYGMAVTTTMLVSTALLYTVCRERWGWSRGRAGALVGLLLTVDLAFFGANVSKLANGAWFPLAVGALIYTLMSTWRKGREMLAGKLAARATPLDDFLRTLETERVARVDGKAVFLTSDTKSVPSALLHNLKHNRIVHAQVSLLTVLTEDVPRVPRARRVEVTLLGQGLSRIVARYGFMETPNVPHVLALAREQGLDLPLENASFFLGRERVTPGKGGQMQRWRQALFAYLLRNGLGATAFFKIPPNQVIELGSQLKL